MTFKKPVACKAVAWFLTLFLIAASMILTGAAPVGPTPFPFASEKALEAVAENVDVAACPSDVPNQALIYVLSINSVDLSPGYWWRVGILNDRFVGIEVRDTKAVQVVFGRVIDGKFVVSESYSLKDAEAKYPEGPCQFLTRRDA